MMPKITKQLAIEFATRLEENEEVMAEGAAMMVTLEQFGFEWGDQGEIFEALPDGEWWSCAACEGNPE